MNPIQIEHLSKKYPGFELTGVSFSLQPGKITGLIGRNGAGKSTTLKCILNFVHPDAGTVRFFGLPFAEHEAEIKEKIGYVAGAFDYYSKKKLKVITNVVRRFYKSWDSEAYRACLTRFALDEEKTPEQLSAGMKVKYALTLALSHNAELLILDEPTSGLDPVSRDELLELFLQLRDEGKTILFSTHITSDLEKCAGHILYIRKGKLAADLPLDTFVGGYRVVTFAEDALTDGQKRNLVGLRRDRQAYSAVIAAEDADRLGIPAKEADLETVMLHLEREEEQL